MSHRKKRNGNTAKRTQNGLSRGSGLPNLPHSCPYLPPTHTFLRLRISRRRCWCCRCRSTSQISLLPPGEALFYIIYSHTHHSCTATMHHHLSLGPTHSSGQARRPPQIRLFCLHCLPPSPKYRPPPPPTSSSACPTATPTASGAQCPTSSRATCLWGTGPTAKTSQLASAGTARSNLCIVALQLPRTRHATQRPLSLHLLQLHVL